MTWARPPGDTMEPTLASLPPDAGETPPTAEQLFQSLYGELHRLAQSQLRRNLTVSLSATTLLHEAFLELSPRDASRFPDRARFMAYAARAMRGLIIDYARNRRALKRGGAFHLTTIDTEAGEEAPDHAELAKIGDAVDELAHIDPALAELVDLRFFVGLSSTQIAALRNVSERTVQRDWLKARVYLRRSLGDGAS